MAFLKQLQYYVYDRFVMEKMVERDNIFVNPLFIAFSLLTYLYIVLIYGPAKMKNKEPYNVRWYTRFFNICQVIANTYTFSYMLYHNLYTEGFSIICMKPFSEMPPEVNEAMYQLSKFNLFVRMSDFSETICFVLAKKFDHISFLHVYHHANVVLALYITLITGYLHIVNFVAMINVFIHIIMYTYFFLATFPSLRSYLWWKKYLTALQISQFVAAFVVIGISARSGCQYPPAANRFLFINCGCFFILFVRFYIQSYTKRKSV